MVAASKRRQAVFWRPKVNSIPSDWREPEASECDPTARFECVGKITIRMKKRLVSFEYDPVREHSVPRATTGIASTLPIRGKVRRVGEVVLPKGLEPLTS